MINTIRLAAAILLGLGANQAALAYGQSSSGHHCDKPMFSHFEPPANRYLQSFDEFSFVASANTTASSIVVNISLGEVKFHFANKDLHIMPMNGGRIFVSGKLERPIGHGFARMSVTAHSKPSCEVTEGFLVRIY